MPAHTSGVLRPDNHDKDAGSSSNQTDDSSDDEAKPSGWWAYFIEKIEGAKAWADGIIHPNTEEDD